MIFRHIWIHFWIFNRIYYRVKRWRQMTVINPHEPISFNRIYMYITVHKRNSHSCMKNDDAVCLEAHNESIKLRKIVTETHFECLVHLNIHWLDVAYLIQIEKFNSKVCTRFAITILTGQKVKPNWNLQAKPPAFWAVLCYRLHRHTYTYMRSMVFGTMLVFVSPTPPPTIAS